MASEEMSTGQQVSDMDIIIVQVCLICFLCCSLTYFSWWGSIFRKNMQTMTIIMAAGSRYYFCISGINSIMLMVHAAMRGLNTL